MQVAILMIANKMSRFENAIRVCPLGERIDFVEDWGCMIKSNIGGYDIDTHIGNSMRYFVFDKRIDVIGTTSEKDYHSVVGNSTL